jgi:hypothetical protein
MLQSWVMWTCNVFRSRSWGDSPVPVFPGYGYGAPFQFEDGATPPDHSPVEITRHADAPMLVLRVCRGYPDWMAKS